LRHPDSGLRVLYHLCHVEPSHEEIALLARLILQPDVNRRLCEHLQHINTEGVTEALVQSEWLGTQHRFSMGSGGIGEEEQDLYHSEENERAGARRGTRGSSLSLETAPLQIRSNSRVDSGITEEGHFPRGMIQINTDEDTTLPPLSPTKVASVVSATNTSNQRSGPTTQTSTAGTSQRANKLSPLETVSLGGTFTSHAKHVALQPYHLHNSHARNGAVVQTCISGPGNTIAIVQKGLFLIYKNPCGRDFNGKPKYIGIFEVGGCWTSGQDNAYLTKQGPILEDPRNCQFSSAASSDDLLAVGAPFSSCLMIFSIADEKRPGRCVFKREKGENGTVIRKILFNPRGHELVVQSRSNRMPTELWEFYSVGKDLPRRSHGIVEVSPDCAISVDMTLRNGDEEFGCTTTEAKFSEDGRKVVACTDHLDGAALVCILVKGGEGAWSLWGKRRIGRDISVHDWDVDCLGFTGVGL
jgi:hypothetical protein